MGTTEQTTTDIPLQCTRCRNKHMQSERLPVFVGENLRSPTGCPQCGGRTYFDIREQAAWCWSSGLIETGDEDDLPEGATLVARGAHAFLNGAIAALACGGRGANEGKNLVPGVAEEEDDAAKGRALAKWLKRCAANNGHAGRYGVVFVAPND